MENNEQDNQPTELVRLDVQKVKSLIPSYSSEKLCEMIVANRFFHISEEITIACMEELGKRRGEGNNFAFEKYIEDCTAKMPKFDFKMPDLRTTLQQAIKGIK